MKAAPLITEFLWLPLVTIGPTQRGFLVQPGSTTPPQRFEAGKYWHWPYLTSIRVIDLQPHRYRINRQIHVSKTSFGDEPIVAATKDMRLVSLEGQLAIQIDPQASDAVLAKLSKHSINRLVRPLIRSGIRLAVAETNFAQLSNLQKLTRQAKTLTDQQLSQHGIDLIDLQIESARPFSLFHSPQNN